MKKTTEELILEQIDAALAARDEKEQVQRIRDNIEAKLKSLGYDNPDAPDAQLVLLRAKAANASDVLDAIQQAHDTFDEYLAERSGTPVSRDLADAGAENSPTGGEESADETPSPTADGEIPSMKDMKASMQDHLGLLYDQSNLGDAAV